MNAPLHQYLPLDETARHFIIGDPHGRYYDIQEILHKVGFDDDVDYLYFVGDMIDRGQDSAAVLRMLENDRVFSVMGNHEFMALNLNKWHNVWMSNGGETTMASLKKENLTFDWLLDKCRPLPVALTVGEPDNPNSFRIVHADIPLDVGWPAIIQLLEDGDIDSNEIQQLLWGREIIRIHYSSNMSDLIQLAKFVKANNPIRTFIGHSGVRKVTKVGNITYLDGSPNQLHIVEALSGETHSIAASM